MKFVDQSAWLRIAGCATVACGLVGCSQPLYVAEVRNLSGQYATVQMRVSTGPNTGNLVRQLNLAPRDKGTLSAGISAGSREVFLEADSKSRTGIPPRFVLNPGRTILNLEPRGTTYDAPLEFRFIGDASGPAPAEGGAQSAAPVRDYGPAPVVTNRPVPEARPPVTTHPPMPTPQPSPVPAPPARPNPAPAAPPAAPAAPAAPTAGQPILSFTDDEVTVDVMSIRRDGPTVFVDYVVRSPVKNRHLVANPGDSRAMASGAREYAPSQLVLGAVGQERSNVNLLAGDSVEGRMRFDGIPPDVTSLIGLRMEFVNLRFQWQQAIAIAPK